MLTLLHLTKRHLLFTLCGVALICSLSACQQAMKPVAPMPELSIGLMRGIQAMGTTDLLAGTLPETRGFASAEELDAFNNQFFSTLKNGTTRAFTLVPAGVSTTPLQQDHRSALKKFVEQGKAMGVDLLIVPMILSWTDRAGSAIGVTSSAQLTMDVYLIDVRDEGSLLKRAHFSEKQQGLSANLLDAGTFFKRGGKWVTTLDLAKEATEQAIKEFGL